MAEFIEFVRYNEQIALDFPQLIPASGSETIASAVYSVYNAAGVALVTDQAADQITAASGSAGTFITVIAKPSAWSLPVPASRSGDTYTISSVQTDSNGGVFSPSGLLVVLPAGT